MLPRDHNERIAAGAFVAALLIYAAVLFANTSEVAGGSDSSGYANEARAIAHGVVHERITELDRFGVDDSFAGPFTPLGYTPSRPRYATTTYPPGLPMHSLIHVSIW